MVDWALKSNDFSNKHTESLFLPCKLVLHTLQVLIMAHPFLHFISSTGVFPPLSCSNRKKEKKWTSEIPYLLQLRGSWWYRMDYDVLLTDAVSGNDVIFTDAVSDDDAFSPMRSVIITCASALNTECSEGKIQYWGRSFLYWNLWGISHKQWKQNYHVHKIVTHMVTLYQKKRRLYLWIFVLFGGNPSGHNRKIHNFIPEAVLPQSHWFLNPWNDEHPTWLVVLGRVFHSNTADRIGQFRWNVILISRNNFLHGDSSTRKLKSKIITHYGFSSIFFVTRIEVGRSLWRHSTQKHKTPRCRV